MLIDAPIATTAPATLGQLADGTPAFVPTLILPDTTALAAYTGTATLVMLANGDSYAYNSSSSMTVVGSIVVNATGKGVGRWLKIVSHNTVVVADITALQAQPGIAGATVIVTDPERGGTFSYYASGYTANDGTVFSASGGGYWVRQDKLVVSVKDFGAKGDGITDDTAAFINALKSNTNVVIPPTSSYYKITGLLTFTGLTNLSIDATGATIRNADKTTQSFLFASCSDIKITGGDWGYSQTITANGGASQHVLQFEQCKRVLVDRVHVSSSPEMAIAITDSFDVTVQNSLLENCWRDGTYSHYSANVKYLGNTYRQIKDDAMSFHDYGLDSQRTFINALGYTQAQNCIAENNIINQCFQGFSSVGGKNLQVKNNNIQNTISGGIVVMNRTDLFTGGNANVTNVEISNNLLLSNCTTQTIVGSTISPSGGGSTDRGAIIVACLTDSATIDPSYKSKRLSDIQVKNNFVKNSGAVGIHIDNTDRINNSGNVIQDCNQNVGVPVEIWSVSNYSEDAINTVIDTRTPIQHQYGVSFDGSAGKHLKWNVINRTTKDILNQVGSALESFDQRVVVNLTANYTFDIEDIGKTFQLQSNNLTLTVPINLANIGWWVNITLSYGVTNATLTPASGVNINYGTILQSLTGPFTNYLLHQTDGNWFILTGDTGKKLKTGTVSLSGDGSTTAFAFPHGFGANPSYIDIKALSAQADNSNIKYITSDASSLVVVYKVAPVSGTGNIVLGWAASL